MGCSASKKQKSTAKIVPNDIQQNKGKTNNNLGIKPETTKPSEKNEIFPRVNSEFRISQADLVQEKLGQISKDYLLLSPPLGQGGYGEVRKCIHKSTGILRAVKIIKKDKQTQEEQEILKNEVSILRQLDHPNIVKIYEFYQDQKHFYIVTDLCVGGELFDKIIELKYFNEKLAAQTMKQILSAVVYCHKHNIVHRDLKPENLLYESTKEDALLKVIDFGTSKVFDQTQKMNGRFGTPYYIAPEVAKKKQYNEKCDVWSSGVILYTLLCGYPPFNGDNDIKIIQAVQKGDFNFNGPEWKSVSEDAKQLIKKMLEYNPDKRCSAEDALNDKWILQNISNTEVDQELALQALTNLKNFRAGRKLQEATWVYLVSYLTTKEEKNELLSTFQSLDLNNDGQLSREELIIGFQKIINAAEAEEAVNNILKSVDANQSGQIDYSEWVMATMSRQKLLSKQRLETAFKMFDKDGNGFISMDELREVFNANNVDTQLMRDMIKEVDDNGDGQISITEFKEMMLKFLN